MSIRHLDGVGELRAEGWKRRHHTCTHELPQDAPHVQSHLCCRFSRSFQHLHCHILNAQSHLRGSRCEPGLDVHNAAQLQAVLLDSKARSDGKKPTSPINVIFFLKKMTQACPCTAPVGTGTKPAHHTWFKLMAVSTWFPKHALRISYALSCTFRASWECGQELGLRLV